MVELLIVDDEPDIPEILDSLLSQKRLLIDGQNHDIKITCATNGLEAFELVQHRWFDAILSDINMPKMDGLELLANIRGLGKEVPLIFLTGFGDKEQAVRALRLGCFDFLDKPLKLEKLIEVVFRALQFGYRGREIERELEARLAKLQELPAERRRQLRLVFRSMILVEMDRAKKIKSESVGAQNAAASKMGALMGKVPPNAAAPVRTKKPRKAA